MFEVGAEIKRRREEQGISQNQLAKMSGCAQSTLSAIEKTTKKPSTETVKGIAAALGCTVAELMGETAENLVNPVLTRKETELLRIFRQLNRDGQDMVMDSARSAVEKASLRKETTTASAV